MSEYVLQRLGTSGVEVFVSRRRAPPPLVDLSNAECRALIKAVIERHPSLTDFGFGVYAERTLTREEYTARFAKDRAALLQGEGLQGFRRAHTWLGLYRKTRRINPRTGGRYAIKHVAERQMGGYISNGELIAAAVALGFRAEPTEWGSPNAFFNISKKCRHRDRAWLVMHRCC